jgi:hypothetical protein
MVLWPRSDRQRHQCPSAQGRGSLGSFARQPETFAPQRPPAMDANRSQSTVERVSARGDKICLERVCASQRPGAVLAPRSAVSRSGDRRLRSGLRECRGKPGVFPETARNRLIAKLRGGAGRTQTSNQAIMRPELIINVQSKFGRFS